MSDEAALLAAIFAHPEEDTPRLVYADWLDEQGGKANAERAEYIRLECELAQIDEDDISRETSARQKVLSARSNEIEERYRKAWGAALVGRKGPLRGRGCFFHFRRGFPGNAYAPADRLIAEGDTLFSVAPITELDVTDVAPDNLEPLLERPWMANVRHLTLSGTYNDDDPRPDWSELADCPHLCNLNYLWLARGQLPKAGGARIAARNPFPRLRRFMLSENDSDACIAGLFGGPAFGQLEEVYFHKCGMGNAAVKVLARSPGLAGVRKLSLPNQPLSVAAIRSMLAGRYWANLRELTLWACELGDAEARALAKAAPTQLRVLNLSMNSIGPRGIAALAASPILNRLEVLELSDSPIGDRGIESLLGALRSRNLRRLDLGDCGIGPEGAKALAGCPALAGLLHLTLYSNAIGAEGALALADSPHLGNLEFLMPGGVRGKARKRLKAKFGDRVHF